MKWWTDCCDQPFLGFKTPRLWVQQQCRSLTPLPTSRRSPHISASISVWCQMGQGLYRSCTAGRLTECTECSHRHRRTWRWGATCIKKTENRKREGDCHAVVWRWGKSRFYRIRREKHRRNEKLFRTKPKLTPDHMGGGKKRNKTDTRAWPE